MTKQHFSVSISAPRTPVVEKAAALLCRTVAERTGIRVERVPSGIAALDLALDSDAAPAEAFRIEDAALHTVRIAGGDARGLLYGVGKFLRSSRFDEGTFSPCTWRGGSAPDCPVRGLYFATHFYNWYHQAPIEEIERYIEELALQGCNTLSVWFDMHHYTGIGQPAAQAMLARLKAMLQAASVVGMGPALTLLANEAYADSPKALRAAGTGLGHYGVELCPSVPEGRRLILEWRREVLEAFADIDLRYIWIWPYDQGGCACGRCAPWGCNGFLKIGRAVAGLCRDTHPNAEIVLSTWLFDRKAHAEDDRGEFAGLDAALRQDASWVNWLMIDSHQEFPRYPLEHGVPGGLPALNFPEISMFGMAPWGGYGANPAPERFQAIWDRAGHLLSGGFPYSEGIFEDINKAVCLGFYWDRNRRAVDTVWEYAAYEFGPDAAENATRVVQRLERAHGHRAVRDSQTGELRHLLPNADPAAADECCALLRDAESRLPQFAREGWRFRILKLRAELDRELSVGGGRHTEFADACFRELAELYRVDPARTIASVRPPFRMGG
ncbi:MAG: hypothetical protein GXP31_13870 [Kiritimatiellaeota bacterium]|nr:hypothetical protein [Kiritimatiellota bacterium]